MLSKLKFVIDATRKLLGDEFVGMQDDVWSKRSCRQSFGASRLSLAVNGDWLDQVLAQYELCIKRSNQKMEKVHAFLRESAMVGVRETRQYAGTIVESLPVVAFTTLPSSRHTGSCLARWKQKTWSDLSMSQRDLSLNTEDGASNNKKCNKILNLDSQVCAAHDLQRAVLIAQGSGSKPSQNVELNAFQAKSAKMGAVFSRSAVANADFFKSQEQAGERKKNVECPNQTRWLGLLRQAESNRQKEPHINMALCGDKHGRQDLSDDESDPGEVEMEGGSGCSGEDSEVEVSADSDDDRVEAAERCANKQYPLAHRLLTKEEFSLNAYWESCLSFAGETSALLQTHKGVGLDDAYLLMYTLKSMNDKSKMQVVSGRGAKESWDEVRVDRIPAMFQRFRQIFSEQIDKRFSVHNGVPSDHVLLALKMNPTIDTTAEGHLFKNRRSLIDLMEIAYRKALRKRAFYRDRHTASEAEAALSAASQIADSSASSPVQARCPTGSSKRPSPSPSDGIGSSGGKRPKMLMMALNAFVPTQTAPDPVDNNIDIEIKLFSELCRTNFHNLYVNAKGHFDKSSFWIAYRHKLPYHYAVYLADCASKKAASAHVESVFSGAKRMAESAALMSDENLSAFVMCHYLWEVEWLRPNIHDIMCAYVMAHGPEDVPDEFEVPSTNSMICMLACLLHNLFACS